MSDADNNTTNPLIEFQEDGRAAVLQYDLPTSSTYHGVRLVDLTIPRAWFRDLGTQPGPDVKDPPAEPILPLLPPALARVESELRATGDADDAIRADKWHDAFNEAVAQDEAVTEGRIAAAKALEGFLGKIKDLTILQDERWEEVWRQVRDEAYAEVAQNLVNTDLWFDEYQHLLGSESEAQGDDLRPWLYMTRSTATGAEPGDRAQAGLSVKDIVALAASGIRVVPVMLQSGRVAGKLVREPDETEPRIVVLEYYRLSSYLGDYGAGKTLNTFTLLPGEESTITIRTWKQIAETRIQSSSILDSYEDQVADEFQEDVQNESTNRRQNSESEGWNVETSASASWGFGRASVKAGAHGTYNSSREDFARNVNNALTKHAAKASHQRKVEINSSTEQREEAGEEVLVTRTIKNINLSRVMNFVFRELNQEFISYLHLTDIRVAFVNGFPLATRVVTLPELNDLLIDYIVPAHRKEVFDSILQAYQQVLDFRDNTVALIETAPDQYLRVKRGALTDDPELSEGQHFDAETPGIIIGKNNNILPTDAIIVDALLGKGMALDQYALDSQDETLRAKKVDNDFSEAEVERLRLALEIVRNKDAEQAELFEKLFEVEAEIEGGEEGGG